MVDPLSPLLADGVVDEVVARLKSGKEADLWLVRHGGEVVAAKVYKERQTRSFRNDAVYREGRRVRDTRTQRAMDRGSRFGQAAGEAAWKAKEADALYALHAAGVRVPQPVMFYEGVLLMELVVDGHGQPAPRLVDARVPRERAASLYADLRGQVVRMLTCDLVHGDLSPYNVLLGRDGPVLIDFPQVVGAAHNTQAESFLRRDLENLRRFLAAIDPALHAAAGDAREIWRAYARRELTPDFVPTGAAEPPRGGRHERPAERRSERPTERHPDRAAERHPANRRGEPLRDRHAGAPRASERSHPARPQRGHPRQEASPPAGRTGRGGPERRRGAPMPEVVRVVRPPLAPARTGQAPHPKPAPPPAGAQRSRRRRRR
jgi:RIO kinase 1